MKLFLEKAVYVSFRATPSWRDKLADFLHECGHRKVDRNLRNHSGVIDGNFPLKAIPDLKRFAALHKIQLDFKEEQQDDEKSI
ncbi:MAG: hypothetical protein AAF242_05295 [Bacteroidota bacterium]